MTNHTRAIINGRYDGNSPSLLRLALVTSLFTILTAGVYRFWAKTRIRKYIWSSTAADGDRFEYTGTGLEKFLGFLVAITFLAVYLGLVQMALFFFGLNLFIQPQTEQQLLAQTAAIYISFLAVVPFIYFAQYRARRYKLARTRWRGIRFGADRAAWGYVMRAIGHNLITIISLGILLPRQTFYLEKYLTDRTWYGDKKFHQDGKWTDLYKAMAQLFIGILIMLCGVALAVISSGPFFTVIFLLVGYVWFFVGIVSFRVQSFIYLTSQKTLGGDIRFTGSPFTPTIIKTLIVGGILVGIVAAIGSAILIAILNSVFQTASITSQSGAIALIVIGYLALIILIGALSIVAITQPIIQHVVESVVVHNASALSGVRQREVDTSADAEGFAEALDVGGAF